MFATVQYTLVIAHMVYVCEGLGNTAIQQSDWLCVDATGATVQCIRWKHYSIYFDTNCECVFTKHSTFANVLMKLVCCVKYVC